MKRPFLPFALPTVEEDEIEAVAAVMRSGWLTTGPVAADFEQAFASAVGARHALAVNSATAGLHLALDAAGVGPGDVVLTTCWTFTATAEVARYLGAEVRFVDVDPATLNMDPAQVARVLEGPDASRIRALVPVHFGGRACDMSALMPIARQHGLSVIEDAAHAFPATASVCEGETKNIGQIGDSTVFSFYVTKTITTGEGGMITTDDSEKAARMRRMRLHGISRDVWDRYHTNRPKWHYDVVEAGYKYNMTDMAAALGRCQLGKAERFRQRREAIAQRYQAAFAQMAEFERPLEAAPGELHAWHLYVLRLNLERLEINRDRFIEEMAERGIGCSVHFIPLHLQPFWRDRYALTEADLPIASREYQRVVSLPIFHGMDDDDVEAVISAAQDVAVRFRR